MAPGVVVGRALGVGDHPVVVMNVVVADDDVAAVTEDLDAGAAVTDVRVLDQHVVTVEEPDRIAVALGDRKVT